MKSLIVLETSEVDWLPFYLSLLAEALNFIVMENYNLMNFSVAVDADLYIDPM